MKYSIVTTLAAAALLMGCIRLPDDGGGPVTDAHFKLELSPVRSVTFDSWSVPPQPGSTGGGSATGAAGSSTSSPKLSAPPTEPPTFPTTVRIEGSGSVEQIWANAQGGGTPLQRGDISLSYAFSIDNGCSALAQQAQQEGRILVVEGTGTVAELEVMMAPCPAIACAPPPQPADQNPLPYPCGCPTPAPSFLVRADQLVSCSLGGNVILTPTKPLLD